MTERFVNCPVCDTALESKDTLPSGVFEANCPRCGTAVPLTSVSDADSAEDIPSASAVDDGPDDVPAAEVVENQPTCTVTSEPILLSAGSSITQTAPPGPPAAPDYSFLSPPQQPDELGRLGSYRILGVLGAGGMGVVFRAEDPSLRRFLALKVMLPHFASNPTAKARFLREARAQAAVEHDHIIPIYEVFEENGIPYIAMPLLKGQTLADSLKANSAIPINEAVRIAREIALGLAAAHEEGLVHRDIKPANVWLEGKHRRVKILDFGLARAEAHDGEDADLVTKEGAIIGTPAFMSPEQAQGQSVDVRTDLFSLGAVLYQMLTRRLPFTGTNSTAVLVAVVLEQPKRPAELNPMVPPGLDALTMRLLAKSAAHRPASAEAVVAALTTPEANLSLATPISVPVLVLPPVANNAPDPWFTIDATEADSIVLVSPVKPPPERPWLLIAAIVGLFLAVVVTGVVVARSRPQVTEQEVTPVEVTKASPVPEEKPAIATVPITLKRGDISALALSNIGDGDPARCSQDLVGVFGDPGFRLSGYTRFPAYSPDGSLLAVPSGSTVVLFDTRTGRQVRVLRPVLNGDNVSTTDFSPDGTILAAGHSNGRVRVWDVRSGRELMDAVGHSWFCNQVKFSPVGDKFVSVGVGGVVRIWKVGDPQPVRSVRPTVDNLSGVAVSPNGRWGAAVGRQQGIVFDLEKGTPTGVLELSDDKGLAVEFLDNERIAVGDWQSVRVFRLGEDGVPQKTETHSLSIPGQWLGVLTPNDLLAAPHQRNQSSPTLVGRDLSNDTERSRVELPTGGSWLQYALSKSRKEVAALSANYVHRIDLTRGAYQVEDPGHHLGCVATAFSPDAKWLVTGAKDHSVLVWEAATGKRVASFRQLNGEVWSLAFDPTGRYLAGGVGSGEIYIWKTANWNAPPTVLRAHSSTVRSLAFTPNGRLMLSGSSDGGAQLWETDSWAPTTTLVGNHKDGVRGVAAFPDNRQFVTVGQDRVIRVQARNGREESWTLDNPVTGVTITNDGKRMLVTTDAGQKPAEVRIISVADRSQETLLGHCDHATALALREDNRLLATGGYDGQLIVWDLESKPVRRVVLHQGTLTGRIESISFARDGRHIAAGTECGLVLMFRLPAIGEDPRPWMESRGAPPRARSSDADWETAVAKLNGPNIGLAVADRLRERNPFMNRAVAFGFEEGNLTRMEMNTDDATDISPLRALKGLKSLSMRGSNTGASRNISYVGGGLGKLTDLSPLRGLSLTTLNLSDNRNLSDLQPIANQKLVELHVANTSVADLAPLKGQPLRLLHTGHCPATDLRPIASCPLEDLLLGWGQVRDLKPLRGMKLRYLDVGHTGISDLSGIEEMPLRKLSFHSSKVSDLTPLAGIPLVELYLDDSRVEDLSPVRMDALEVVNISGLKLKGKDIARLREAPLRTINTKPAADFWSNGQSNAATLNQGIAHWKSGKKAEALETFREVVRLNPNDTLAHDWLAHVLLDANDAKNALLIAEKSVRLNPNAAYARWNLGRARVQTGDVDGALLAFQEAVNREPNRESYKSILAAALRLKREKSDLEIAPLPRSVENSEGSR